MISTLRFPFSIAPMAMLLVAASAGSVLAQSDSVSPPGRWGVTTTLGTGGTGGGYGDFLEKPVDFNLSLFKASRSGAWRFGGGIQFGSMAMKPPYEDEKEWAHLEPYLFTSRVFNPGGKVRPYLQARIGLARIHPRSELFNFVPTEPLAPGDSPTKPVNGVSFTLQPGFELDLTKSLALDVAGFWNYYSTGEYDLAPIGMPPVSDGQEWGLRLGVTWRPNFPGVPEPPKSVLDPATGTLAALPPPDGDRDAWGVRKSWGWATAEMLGINFGASMFNEYVRNANFNQISPRSWKANFEEGFTYDDNKFKTNQLVHPFNGATYFNSARANGIGFWGSSAVALTGAFIWECCGETHPMSWNDLISTGLGGIARGEWAYRLSSLILNNTKSGKGRFLREAAAFPVNPVRGFNRVLSGDASEVTGNPVDPYDWRPPNLGMQLSTGARVIGEGESITDNTNTYGFVEFDLHYGNPWDTEHKKPFDRFDTGIQWNVGDKTRIGRLQIRGDLWSKPLGGAGSHHALAVVQDFDYVDNEAYEYAAQSFGLSLSSRFRAESRTRILTRVFAHAMPLAAVNADYSYVADVPDKERDREYDYGPGYGGGAEAYVVRSGRPLLTASYRIARIHVSNGSIYQSEADLLGGSDADHTIQVVALRLVVPVSRVVGIGADGVIFLRKSRYSLSERFKAIDQRNPQVRLYLALNWGTD